MILLVLIIAVILGTIYALHHALIFLILAIVAYLIFHGHHSRGNWNRNHHRSFFSRIWVSAPGPFGTRIGKRV